MGATPIAMPASVGSTPVLTFSQNSRSLARGCDGAPGDRNGARPVTSLIQFDGLPTTPSDQVLLPPVEPSQFRSNAFVRLLKNNGITGSMGRVGACGDNAAMESFFALLQKNVLDRQRWATRAELRLAMVVWIERTYHRRRRQRRLGKLTPIEFETINVALKAA